MAVSEGACYEQKCYGMGNGKVVINTTNNHVVICSNKNYNSQKWNISCHISKQGCHSLQQLQPSVSS